MGSFVAGVESNLSKNCLQCHFLLKKCKILSKVTPVTLNLMSQKP